MSYKNDLAGLKLGGGKSVIIGNPKKLGTPALMQAFGRHIDRLGGAYYTAEDVGTSPTMMEEVRSVTEGVAGLDSGEFATGDPSPHTALGVFYGIKAAARECGLSYSRMIDGLKKQNIEIDRRVLADLAVHEKEAFAALAEKAKEALAA